MGVNVQDPGFFRFSGEWVLARRHRRALRSVLNYMYRRTERCLALRTPVVDVLSYMARKDDLAAAQAEVIYSTFRDRGSGLSTDELWKANDRANRRRDGDYKNHAGKLPRLGVFLSASFPRGVSLEDAKTALDRFLDFLESEFGVACEAVIHAKEAGVPDHAHILMTDRLVDANGIGPKVRKLNGVAAKIEGRGIVDGDAVLAPGMEAMRSSWAEAIRAIAPADARPIDPRSLARRGITIPPVTIFSHAEVRRQAEAGDEWWKRIRAHELAERNASEDRRTGDVLQTPEEIEEPVAPAHDTQISDDGATSNGERGASPAVDASAIIARLKTQTRRPQRATSMIHAGILAVHAKQRLNGAHEAATTAAAASTELKAAVRSRESVAALRLHGMPYRDEGRLSAEAKGSRNEAFERVQTGTGGIVGTQSDKLPPHADPPKLLTRSSATIAFATLLALVDLWFRKLGADRAKLARRPHRNLMIALVNTRASGGGSASINTLLAAAITALRKRDETDREKATAAASTERQSAGTRRDGEISANLGAVSNTAITNAASSSRDSRKANTVKRALPTVPTNILFEGSIAEALRAQSAIQSMAKSSSVPDAVLLQSANGEGSKAEKKLEDGLDRAVKQQLAGVLGPVSAAMTPSMTAPYRKAVAQMPTMRSAIEHLQGKSLRGGADATKQALHADAAAEGSALLQRSLNVVSKAGAPALSLLNQQSALSASAPIQGWPRGQTDLPPAAQSPITGHQMRAETTGIDTPIMSRAPVTLDHAGPISSDEVKVASQVRPEVVDEAARLAFKFAAALYQDRKWRAEFGATLKTVVGFDGDFDIQMQRSHTRLFGEARWAPIEVKKAVRDKAREMNFSDLIVAFNHIETTIREARNGRKARIGRLALSSKVSPALPPSSDDRAGKESGRSS